MPVDAHPSTKQSINNKRVAVPLGTINAVIAPPVVMPCALQSIQIVAVDAPVSDIWLADEAVILSDRQALKRHLFAVAGKLKQVYAPEQTAPWTIILLNEDPLLAPELLKKVHAPEEESPCTIESERDDPLNDVVETPIKFVFVTPWIVSPSILLWEAVVIAIPVKLPVGSTLSYVIFCMAQLSQLVAAIPIKLVSVGQF